jgi:signal transduction histidine kinase
MDLGRVARLACWPLALAVGLVDLALAALGPTASTGATILAVAAGWAAAATGLLQWARRPAGRTGALLAAAGMLWLLESWNTPAIGSPAGFAVGLVSYAAAPPLLAHAVLTFPDEPLSRAERVGVGLAYAASTVLLGLLPALVFDPEAQGCARCPANPLRIADLPQVYADLNVAGLWLGLLWAPLLILVLALQLARRTRALVNVKAPLAAAAVGYLGLVAWQHQRGLGAGFLGNDLRTGRAVALAAVAAGIWWTVLRARQVRTATARLIIELSQAPAAGTLRDLLAAMLGDPTLQLAYPRSSGGFVDAAGRPVAIDSGPGTARAITPLRAPGRSVAVLTHRAGLLADPALADEIAAGCLLVLENERLQAELNAHLIDLRDSRARIAEAADSERRRLERDLHDVAQQQLAALLMFTGLARTRSASPVLERVEQELHQAAEELRTLARGIFPALLADDGLAAAVESLAEHAPVRIVALPSARFRPAVETTAYFVIAHAVPQHGTLTVQAVQRDGRLIIDLAGAGPVPEVPDRIAVLDGQLSSTGPGQIRVELPCGS